MIHSIVAGNVHKTKMVGHVLMLGSSPHVSNGKLIVWRSPNHGCQSYVPYGELMLVDDSLGINPEP